MKDTTDKPALSEEAQTDASLEKATPLRCFLASSLSGAIAYCCYLLLTSIVHTYGAKAVTSSNPIVINLTAAVRTMVMGIVALGTGVFGVVALGLLLLGIQVTIKSFKQA
ncbi:MAG: DUF3082 domain-containing protein [Cyanobacteria bacterium P01_C01_bin.72]